VGAAATRRKEEARKARRKEVIFIKVVGNF